MQEDEEVEGEYFPAAQLKHKAAPPLPLYLPAGHTAHEDEPGTAAYVPATQLVHVDASAAPTSGDAVPAGHRVQLEEPIREYEPTAQGLQAVEPTADEDPGGH